MNQLLTDMPAKVMPLARCAHLSISLWMMPYSSLEDANLISYGALNFGATRYLFGRWNF
ncbi:MAG: hypothetical protein R2865_09385 [Deinococcales bacterium]